MHLHADVKELKKGEYNKQGKEIIKWVETNHVTLIRELEYKFTSNLYRDGIHLNEKGQGKLAQIMVKNIPQYLK